MAATENLIDTSWSIDLSSIELTDAQFYQLCTDNPNLRIEISAAGELIIMPPAFGDTGRRNIKLSARVSNWNEQTQLGEAFDSSTGYILPDGSKLSPDVSWIENSRLVDINLNQFIPIAPDFVIELRSSTDRLPPLRAKMQVYQANGVRLGWLINPQDRSIEIYRLGQESEIIMSPTTISGEDVLPGFNLDLTTIW
jgi:Uma2 family endonuclease